MQGADDFSITLRVYWEDTDAGGVVFYANHLKYFERARTEWLRARGVAQQALREATGVVFIVAEAQLKYHAPARLDDLLQVSVQPGAIGHATMWLQQQARCGDRLLCEGRIRIGCVDAGTFRPRRFPPAVLQALRPPPAGTRPPPPDPQSTGTP